MAILSLDRIRLQATATDKADAIRQAGALLVDSGCVDAGYVAGMLTREESMSTYLGNGVAIPHGTYDNKEQVHQTAISVLQLPDGVEWEDGEKAYLIVGIAAASDEHVGVLANEKPVNGTEPSSLPPMADNVIRGIAAAPGLAIGPLFQFARSEITVTETFSTLRPKKPDCKRLSNRHGASYLLCTSKCASARPPMKPPFSMFI